MTRAPLDFSNTAGPAFSQKKDGARISKQHERIRDLMLDGVWRSLHRIATLTGYPEASISAQLRHLRKERFGSYAVDRKRADDPSGTWVYRVSPPSTEGASR
jgi:hypothetical protein